MAQREHLLLVDSDPALLKTISSQALATHFPLLGADGEQQAIATIQEDKTRISAAIVSLNIGVEQCLNVIRLLHHFRPLSSAYLLYDGGQPYDKEDLVRLGLHGTLVRPATCDQLLLSLSSSHSPPSAEPTPQEVEIRDWADTEVERIEMTSIKIGAWYTLDLWGLLPSGKYRRVLGAREKAQPEHLRQLKELGVKALFILVAAKNALVSACKEAIEGWKKNQNKPPNTSLQEKLATLGIPKERIQYGFKFANDALRLLDTLNYSKSPKIREFLQDPALLLHGYEVAILTPLIALPLKMQYERVSRVLALSSLLHDIGMLQLPANLRGYPNPSWDESLHKQYQQHTIHGPEILSELPRIDAAVLQIVEQHHERKDKSGYPHQIGGTHVNKIAEIVGIADVYATLLDTATSRSQFFEALEAELPKFSSDVVAALRSTLFPVMKKA